VNSPGGDCGGVGAGGGALGFAGEAGDWNKRVNSPAGFSGSGVGVCGRPAGFAGGMVEADGAGDWNDRVNSPGCDWGGAGAGGGAVGFAGDAGDWNKRVNSPAGFSGSGRGTGVC
jgi:hypothetical protein